MMVIGMFLTSSFAVAEECPDYRSSVCLKKIRSDIDTMKYQRARDNAEKQCWSSDEQDGKKLSFKTLTFTASGCNYLYSIERFLGNGAPALEAFEKAHKIASWGCGYGSRDLCALMIEFTKTSVADLLQEFAADVSENKLPTGKKILLRSLKMDKGLPKGLSLYTEEKVKSVLSETHKAKIVSCKDCDLKTGGSAQGREIKSKKLSDSVKDASHLLDLSIHHYGTDIELSVKLYEYPSWKLVWDKKYLTSRIRERVKLFGYDTIATPEQLRRKKYDEYQGSFRILAGFGYARVPNIAGDDRDANKWSFQTRAVERFNQNRSEFGILLGLHLTESSMKNKYGKKSDSTEEEYPSYQLAPGDDDEEITEDDVVLLPYSTCWLLNGIYSHIFFGMSENLSSVRHGVHFGGGFAIANSFQAPTARLGYDLYFGRNFVLTGAAVWIGSMTQQVTLDISVETKPSVGADFVLSYSL